VEENLRQLGRDHLDVVNLRIVGTDSIAERFGALADLREAGLIRHLGLSNVRPHHLAEAQAIAPVVCVQNMYGIGASAEQEAFVRTCGSQGVAFVPFYSIAGTGRTAGASTGTTSDGGGNGGDDDGDVVNSIARAHAVSPAQVRLAWTLHQGPHVLAIPGTGNPDHLTENIAAGALPLSVDELTALNCLRHGTC
jgi:aryl-alcohol dehydrogenase-like predicted oxidoreductase